MRKSNGFARLGGGGSGYEGEDHDDIDEVSDTPLRQRDGASNGNTGGFPKGKNITPLKFTQRRVAVWDSDDDDDSGKHKGHRLALNEEKDNEAGSQMSWLSRQKRDLDALNQKVEELTNKRLCQQSMVFPDVPPKNDNCEDESHEIPETPLPQRGAKVQIKESQE